MSRLIALRRVPAWAAAAAAMVAVTLAVVVAGIGAKPTTFVPVSDFNARDDTTIAAQIAHNRSTPHQRVVCVAYPTAAEVACSDRTVWWTLQGDHALPETTP